MATTTNYGWTTPDDTALVKDGASAIRTLGSSVDTTTKALNPSTTLGDIEYRSSTANTNTRLGIGTTNQVLTVSGGVPAWADASAGGMTLISTTSLTGASVTISSIPQTYIHLYIVIYGVTNATANGSLRLDPNGSNSITSSWGRDSTSSVGTTLNDRIYVGQANNGDILRTDANNSFLTRIYNYTSATNYKTFDTIGIYENTTPVRTPSAAWGGINTNSAITSIILRQSGGNFSTGTVLLYGVK